MQNRIILHQVKDGQVQVMGIRVDYDILYNHPFIKEQIKRDTEALLEERGIRVLKDNGVIEEDEHDDEE